MALNRVAIPSPNYSSRGGTPVRLCVVHTAEGSTSIESLGAFFANPNSGVSSHTGIDDKPNTCGEYVPPGYKAWTQANANPYCIATELCAFASWDSATWNAHPVMLENCRLWIAEECARFGIPIRRLSAHEAQNGVAGVCGHNELGASGGSHWDPGPSFPWDRVLGGAPQPEPEPKPEEEEIVLSELVQYQNQPEVDHLFQVAGGTLWHKYTIDRGATWHNETLMGPGDAEVVTGELKSLSVSVVEETCYVMCEEKGGPVWQCREGPAIGIGNRWDRRKLP